MRLAMAQINTTVGDLKGNTDKIIEYIKKAEKAGTDIVSFPELAISGYPPEDLLLKEDFIQNNLISLERIVEFTEGKLRPVVVVGFIDRTTGKKKGMPYNSAAVIQNGQICGTYNKKLLPNYSIFDEKRYFSSGGEVRLFNLDGVIFGISICEDIWEKGEMTDALSGLSGAKLIININASPFHRKKWQEREKILKQRSVESGAFITYTNMVGGQDSIVFDGHSMVVNPKGCVVSRGKAFSEDFILFDTQFDTDNALKGSAQFIQTCAVDKVTLIHLNAAKPAGWGRDIEPIAAAVMEPCNDDAAEIYKALVLGVSDYCSKNGFKRALVGLSGGIDSAITLSVAVDALGAERVQAVFMPSGFTSAESFEDAEATAKNMGVSLTTFDIKNIFDVYLEKLEPIFSGLPWNIAEENIQARIRGNLLMALSNKCGSIVLTTGNKSEFSVGYATLYGDMAGGFAVIMDLFKLWVYRVTEYINKEKNREWIPRRVLDKEPTAELREDQKDSDSLPPYDILDVILEQYVENDLSVAEIVANGFDMDTVLNVAKMVDRNEYKRRQAPIGIRITPKAFGKDRRLPVTNKYLCGAEH